MMNIYEYLTVFTAFLIILAPAAMVAVAMGVTFGFIEVTFGFASFPSGSVEMIFDAVGGGLRMGGDGLGLVRSTRGSPRRHS